MVLEEMREAVEGDGEGVAAAIEGGAVEARGLAVDDGLDLGERLEGGRQEFFEGHGVEVVDIAGELAFGGGLVVETAGVDFVSGAEGFAATGDATAFVS
jgi:hypothetical protein